MTRYECPNCRFISNTKQVPSWPDNKQPCKKCGTITKVMKFIPRCTQCGKFVGKCSDAFKKTLKVPKDHESFYCEECMAVFIISKKDLKELYRNGI